LEAYECSPRALEWALSPENVANILDLAKYRQQQSRQQVFPFSVSLGLAGDVFVTRSVALLTKTYPILSYPCDKVKPLVVQEIEDERKAEEEAWKTGGADTEVVVTKTCVNGGDKMTVCACVG
jgi:hypothetical protein